MRKRLNRFIEIAMVQMSNNDNEAPPPSYQSAMNLLQRPAITQQPGFLFRQFCVHMCKCGNKNRQNLIIYEFLFQ